MHQEKVSEWAPGGPATLYLLGVLHIGIFAFATGQVDSKYAPVLGFWILACAIPLLMLAMVEMRRGEILFGTMGMVFGGLLGLGGAFSFIKTIFIPGISPMDGWWFFGTGTVFFLLLPAVKRVSRIIFCMIVDIGVALIILGLGMIGVLGPPSIPFKVAGWLALIFALLCWYVATAQLVNTVYKRPVLPI